MKTNMLRKTRSALSEALALILVTSLSMTAFAGKGGTKGKPSGEDGDDGGLPDQSTTPIQFSAAIFDAKADSQLDVPWSDAAEAWVYFDDVNTDGVACGQVYLPEEAGKGYGIIASVSDGVTHLDDTFSFALASSDFAGLRIQGAWKINGIGQIACTLTDDASDDRPIAIADLRDGSLTLVNTVKRVPYYLPIDDFNEVGDVTSFERTLTGNTKKNQPTYEHFHWLNLADGAGGWKKRSLLEQVDTSYRAQINTTGNEIVYFNSDNEIRRLNVSSGTDEMVATTAGSGFSINVRIADDGDVYFFKNIVSRRETTGYPVRWKSSGAIQQLAELQPSVNGVKTIIDVSKSISGDEDIEVLLGIQNSTASDLEIYRPDDSASGVRYPIEVTTGSAATWNSSRQETIAISRPNASGHGLICGQAKIGEAQHGFILTPAE